MADASDEPNSKVPLRLSKKKKSKNTTLLLHFGSGIVEARKPLMAENRERCVVTGKFRRQGRGGGGPGVTAAITHTGSPPVLHQAR